MNDLRSQLAKQKRYDALFVNATKAFAILVLLSLGGILLSLIIGAWPSIQAFGFGFYTSNNWDTVANEYGALAPIYGTLVSRLSLFNRRTRQLWHCDFFDRDVSDFLKKAPRHRH